MIKKFNDKESQAEIVAAYLTGLTIADIARDKKCSCSCIFRILKENNICVRKVKAINFGKTEVDRFLYYVKKNNGCWEWMGFKMPNGYGKFGLSKTGKKILAHRYSYKIHKGEIPDDLVVMHSCDNPGCVNPDHLSLGTIQDNTDDMIKKGRNRKGFTHQHRKQTKDEILEIMFLLKTTNKLQREIAKQFNCAQTHISHIKLGKLSDYADLVIAFQEKYKEDP
jgi:predicted XRE-type DNA-binding protein